MLYDILLISYNFKFSSSASHKYIIYVLVNIYFNLTFILSGIFLLRFKLAVKRESWPRVQHKQFHIKEKNNRIKANIKSNNKNVLRNDKHNLSI